jgi:hypothetical protein
MAAVTQQLCCGCYCLLLEQRTEEGTQTSAALLLLLWLPAKFSC